MRKRRLVWLPIILFQALAFCSSTSAMTYEYRSNIIIAIDLSNSYFTDERRKPKGPIAKNFLKLAKALTSNKNGLEKPLLMQVIPINSQSQGGDTICEWTLKRRRIIRKDPDCTAGNNCSTNPKDFQKALDICATNDVLSQRVDTATDIQGALSLASQLATSQTDESGQRFLVIFSDMAEYRLHNMPVTIAKLSGFHIFVVCSKDLQSDQGRVNFCMDQKNRWTSKFKELGAESVKFVVETGHWEHEAVRFLYQ